MKREPAIAKENKNKPGGQPGNKNAEKWTEAEAIKLADELIDWMCPKLEKDEKTGKISDIHAANIWKLDFLSIVKRLPKDEINVLARKFPSFAKKTELADNIQEAKILKYGSAGKLNPAVSIFTLKVLHGHKETEVYEHKGITLQVSPEFMPKLKKEGEPGEGDE